MYKKILVLHKNPPISYLKALNSINLNFDCEVSPSSFSEYGGLLLIGGEDVLPGLYGGDLITSDVNFIRDKFELDALDYFTSHRLPVLGICRGLQVINVFFGGTLKFVCGHRGDECDVYHSLMPNEFGLVKVNSYHRQAIDRLASNGRIAAISADNVIEAAYFGSNVLGVQFHPERMDDCAAQKIYGIFANAVKTTATAN